PAGVSVIAYRHGDASGAVRLSLKLDRAGNATMIALPREATPNMEDDPVLRELTAHPKHRRCLVTNGRGAVGRARAPAPGEAGAAKVFIGVAEGWKPFAGKDELDDNPSIEIVPLDVTDERSVAALAAEIGGKTDVLVNTAERVRPGGLMDRQGLSLTRDEFETNVFGLMRLGRHFGPAMRARGADGVDHAVAFVHILSVHALANDAASGFAAYNTSQAAALSALQALRAELRGGGVRVCQVLTGAPDDAWREGLPPPKVAPKRLARAVIRALTEGVEESLVGEAATDLFARWRENPGALQKELALWT
ncbi:MAG: SDR family NAD(P)-dependent oxidoreductase, partial [Pseudomonadota bacterium]